MKIYEINIGGVVRIRNEYEIDISTCNYEYTEREATFDECMQYCLAQRRKFYPSIQDQLDAAFHLRNGNTVQQEYIDSLILAVKQTYPKPVENGN